MKSAIRILFIAIILLQSSPVLAAEKSAKETIAEYVKKQFNSDGDDMLQSDYAKYTKLTPTLKEHVEDGVLYDFKHDPFVVVNSYEILDVNEDEKAEKGIGKVSYKRVGRGEVYFRLKKSSPYTKLVIEPETTETISFKLKKEKGRWVVLDPDVPRVSCSSIKRIYAEYLADRKKYQEQLGVTSEGGKFKRIQDNFKAIDQLHCK